MNRDIGTTRSGLRLGYTTGSCAAGAAKAAARMLLGQEEIRQVRLMTPKGIELYLDLEEITRNDTYAECAVRKYSGDDPDVTDGLLVFGKIPGQQIVVGHHLGIIKIQQLPVLDLSAEGRMRPAAARRYLRRDGIPCTPAPDQP